MAVCLSGVVLAWALAALLEAMASAQGVPQEGRLFRWAGVATPYLLGAAAIAALLSVVRPPQRRARASPEFETPRYEAGMDWVMSPWVRVAALLLAGALITAALWGL